jgi:hypothetical protein
MRSKLIIAGVLASVASLAGAGSAAAATTTQLLMPGNAAFSILGYDCGGINEHAFASGFDPASGDPQGDVYMWTTCDTGGKGGHSTTFDAWASITWHLDGSLAAYSVLAAAPPVDPTFSATDGHGDTLYNQTNQAYLTVLATAAPTGLAAVRSGGLWLVSWVPDPTAPPDLIGSSTITATPVGSSAPVVTGTTTGSGSSGLIGPLTPNTTYSVTVTNNDLDGPSPSSQPITITMGPSVLKPGAPTGMTGTWTSPGNSPDPLIVNWSPGVQGDSPIDKYQLLGISFGGGIFNVTVNAPSATDTISTLDDGLNWYILIRAHDVAGWGRWGLLKVPATNA